MPHAKARRREEEKEDREVGADALAMDFMLFNVGPRCPSLSSFLRDSAPSREALWFRIIVSATTASRSTMSFTKDIPLYPCDFRSLTRSNVYPSRAERD